MILALCLVFWACGGDKDETAPAEETATETPAAEEAEVPAEPEADAGVQVAQAILTAFDEAVAEVYERVKEQPALADVQADLEAVYDKYGASMDALNQKYLSLKDQDIELFGSCNGYLGENRGKHVWAMNEKLDKIRYYYQQEGVEEMDDLIHQKLIDLLDRAVKRE
jgi:hypothetical protein